MMLIRKKGFKYLIGLKDNGKVKSLCIMLLKKCGYTKRFNGTKYISFLIKDNEYNKIWDKINNIIKKDLTVNQHTMQQLK